MCNNKSTKIENLKDEKQSLNICTIIINRSSLHGCFNPYSKPQIGTHKFDLIHYLTENGLGHSSGPVHAKNIPSVTDILLQFSKISDKIPLALP